MLMHVLCPYVEEVESKDLFQEQCKTEEKAVTRWQFQVPGTKENGNDYLLALYIRICIFK